MQFERSGVTILGYHSLLAIHEISGIAYSSNRKSSYKRNKEFLWEKQKGICYWCGKSCIFLGDGGQPDEFTLDHIIPLSAGGTNHWRNEIGSCFQCNNGRNKKWEFVRLILWEDKEVENEYAIV